MFIEPMKGFGSISKVDNSFFEKPVFNDKPTPFKDVFSQAIEDVKMTETDLAQKQYLFATGQIDSPHTVSIASTKALTSVEHLIALRNKALEAYNTIMNMNI